MFDKAQKTPGLSDLPELARLVEQSRRPAPPATGSPPTRPRPSKRQDLEERYLRLEGQLSNYRYP